MWIKDCIDYHLGAEEKFRELYAEAQLQNTPDGQEKRKTYLRAYMWHNRFARAIAGKD